MIEGGNYSCRSSDSLKIMDELLWNVTNISSADCVLFRFISWEVLVTVYNILHTALKNIVQLICIGMPVKFPHGTLIELNSSSRHGEGSKHLFLAHSILFATLSRVTYTSLVDWEDWPEIKWEIRWFKSFIFDNAKCNRVLLFGECFDDI